MCPKLSSLIATDLYQIIKVFMYHNLHASNILLTFVCVRTHMEGICVTEHDILIITCPPSAIICSFL